MKTLKILFMCGLTAILVGNIPLKVDAAERVCSLTSNKDCAEEYILNDKVFSTDKNYVRKGKKIESKDIHCGKKLGEFTISGFTDIDKKGDKTVILRTFGDEPVLRFNLTQSLNEFPTESYEIINDKKGNDKEYGVEKNKEGFGKGMLIITRLDSNNHKEKVEYRDFLTGKSNKAKNMEIVLNEEGDYEIALDYAVKGSGPLNKYKYYKQITKFSVRNGIEKGFVKDLQTGKELASGATTKNGFYIDLAKSKYLTVEVEYSGKNGVTKRVSRDGRKFTDPGKYLISVDNKYVSGKNELVVYVKPSNK